MARKIQFFVPEESKAPQAPPAPAAETSRAPSLSGMARSLQAAAAAAIREIDPRLIDESQFKDRISLEDEEVAELAESIRMQGQLIPILVSPLPGGRYRIVYGRRRLAALRHLGLQAKALVREMDEDQAIIAQGQENTFRKDLSWIEKAVFARQLLEAGKSDELVCDTLNIDQKARKAGEKLTGLSRMKQVAARFSTELIEAIGPAPKVGRDRWYEAAQLLEKKGFPPGNQSELAAAIAQAAHAGMASDDRFQLFENRLLQVRTARKDTAPTEPARQTATPFGTVKVNARSATIVVPSRLSADLHRWIADHPDDALKALHDAHKKTEQQ